MRCNTWVSDAKRCPFTRLPFLPPCILPLKPGCTPSFPWIHGGAALHWHCDVISGHARNFHIIAAFQTSYLSCGVISHSPPSRSPGCSLRSFFLLSRSPSTAVSLAASISWLSVTMCLSTGVQLALLKSEKKGKQNPKNKSKQPWYLPQLLQRP